MRLSCQDVFKIGVWGVGGLFYNPPTPQNILFPRLGAGVRGWGYADFLKEMPVVVDFGNTLAILTIIGTGLVYNVREMLHEIHAG